ncbi:hypothetical protein F5Y16DRAFT_191783 [Xylariaceae sp. FL0255]|nr:hypothetical protein F5Y16DRAFT_191783 [Xylariaceae sp. FL0255]
MGDIFSAAYPFKSPSKGLVIRLAKNPSSRHYVMKRSGNHQLFANARFGILTSSIIKRNIQRRELWIHRIIQAEVRERMDEEDRYMTFTEAVQLLAALWPPGDHCSQVTERWTICEELLPHLERFYQLYLDHPA